MTRIPSGQLKALALTSGLPYIALAHAKYRGTSSRQDIIEALATLGFYIANVAPRQMKKGQLSRQRLHQLRYPLQLRARQVIRDRILTKDMQPASNYFCVHCGQPAQEYDHHLGYEEKYWYAVFPICVQCHKWQKGRDIE